MKMLCVSACFPRFYGLAIMAAIIAGCGRVSQPPAKPHSPPAKVAHVVSEVQLNSMELTPEAVQRLGIETAFIETRAMKRLRPYGAEAVLPGGATVIVSAPVTGTIQVPSGKHFPQIGRKVAEHEPLLQLLPMLSVERSVLTPAERIRFAEAKNAIAQAKIDAEGQVKQAEVQVEAMEIALARAERLLREQAGTARAVDDAKAQMSLARKVLEAAVARQKLLADIDLEGAETGTLKPLTIDAPLTGQMRTTLVRPGEMVAAGAPLFEIMNTEVLWVRVPIYVGEIGQIDADGSIELTSIDGRDKGKRVVAKPIDLPPTSAPLAAAVDLYYEVANLQGEIRPGQRLTAQIPLKENVAQNTLPWSAVIHDIYGGQWVYQQTDVGKFVRRRVEVAWVRDGLAVLARGPAAGTTVVTAGAAELSGAEFGFAK